MKRPLRASYGARDNMHALLAFEGHPAQLPADLLGLTDKPPGSYAPGERWWPSVGCGPVEDWWALWWTQPDLQARRGGMVRSEVALWHLDDIGAVDDLRPVMESLSNQGSILLPSTELLGAVAEALLSSGRGRPVLPDLDAWPGVVVALWVRLWPEARRAFSARVAVSPPQGGESVAPPWMFCVPADRALQWSGHQLINVTSGRAQLSRAANWLVGGMDPTFDEVLSACPSLPADLKNLGRMARAADRLERLREAPEPQRALELLRTLLALAPGSDAAVALKREGLNALELGFAGASSTLVLSLANVDLAHLPAGGSLEGALKSWTSRQAPELSLEEASRVLDMLSPTGAENWWRQAVHTSLFAGLTNPDPRWAKAALRWIGLSTAAEVLRTLLPATDGVERCLLEVAPSVELTEAELQQLRYEATWRRWSRLHAWTVMQTLSPSCAMHEQISFPGDPIPGLALLVNHLPGSVVVEEAVSNRSAQLIGLVARRTVREPELLGSIDVGHPAWRALWAAHVEAGGVHWPPGADREALGRGLLHAVLAGDEPEGLLVSLAASLAEIALGLPERATLWEALSTTGRGALLPHMAEALVRRCDAGDQILSVERPLAEEVAICARRGRPSASVLAALLRWSVQVNEDEAIRWLDGPSRLEWPPVAEAVGQAVLARGWKRAAEAIYSRSRDVSELLPAAEACQELLSRWQQWMLGRRTRKFNGSDDAPLVHRVAEIGASLAPDGLEDLWERAGGKRKNLPRSGTPDARWREAARLAQHGALKGGLVALVRELRDDSPHNDDLQELWRVLLDRR